MYYQGASACPITCPETAGLDMIHIAGIDDKG